MNGKNFTSIEDLRKKMYTSVSITKEGEPISASHELDTGEIKEQSPIEETKEHEPHEEVKKVVQVRKETIDLPPDLKKLGLQPVSSSNFASYQNVKLPLADDKILVGLQQPVSSSFRWLAELCMYLLHLVHLNLKKIHGKVVRVVQK